MALTDEVMRISDPTRAASTLQAAAASSNRRALGLRDHTGLQVLRQVSKVVPGPSMKLVHWQVREASEGIILPAERAPLAKHLAKRAGDGARLNINVLGEAVLGEDEATHRLERVIELLNRPDVDLRLGEDLRGRRPARVLAYDDSRGAGRRAAAPALPRCARHHPADVRQPRHGGVPRPRAHHRGVHGGARRAGVRRPRRPASCCRPTCPIATTRSPALRGVGAGPARRGGGAASRCASSRAPTSRWSASRPSSTAGRGAVRDQGRRRRLLQAPARAALRPGVPTPCASASPATTCSTSPGRWRSPAPRGVSDRMDIEMLEGMAPPQARAVAATSATVLLYAPVVATDDFAPAVAYLVRRLDENTAPENFLRAAVRASTPGSPRLRRAGAALPRRGGRPARVGTESPPRPRRGRRDLPVATGPFANRPDDSPAPTRAEIAAGCRHSPGWPAACPCGRGDGASTASRTGATPAPTVRSGTRRRAIAEASTRRWRSRRAAIAGWAGRLPVERADALGGRAGDGRAAPRHAGHHGLDAGKTIAEGDPEVSEAIDFARYYGRSRDRSTLDDSAAPSTAAGSWSSWCRRGTSRTRSRPAECWPPRRGQRGDPQAGPGDRGHRVAPGRAAVARRRAPRRAAVRADPRRRGRASAWSPTPTSTR